MAVGFGGEAQLGEFEDDWVGGQLGVGWDAVTCTSLSTLGCTGTSTCTTGSSHGELVHLGRQFGYNALHHPHLLLAHIFPARHGRPNGGVGQYRMEQAIGLGTEGSGLGLSCGRGEEDGHNNVRGSHTVADQILALRSSPCQGRFDGGAEFLHGPLHLGGNFVWNISVRRGEEGRAGRLDPSVDLRGVGIGAAIQAQRRMGARQESNDGRQSANRRLASTSITTERAGGGSLQPKLNSVSGIAEAARSGGGGGREGVGREGDGGGAEAGDGRQGPEGEEGRAVRVGAGHGVNDADAAGHDSNFGFSMILVGVFRGEFGLETTESWTK